MSKEFTQTNRTKLRRIPKRGVFERDGVYRILDEGFVCHVGFVLAGQPFVIPTGYARIGDDLMIHGSSASRMLRNLAQEIDVCVTVTIIDGLVLARSAFHHSMNYRSVVILGKARVVSDEKERLGALEAFTEHILPGRWAEVRWPTEKELKATMVLSLPIEEASAKIRSGDPVDDDGDYAMDVWAGVLPLNLEAKAAIPDAKLRGGVNIPDYIANYARDSGK